MNQTDASVLAQYGRSEPWQRAYLGGTFDCLHRGHLALFARAKRLAREVVVSLNTDEFAARYKRPPLMPLADRLAVLDACRLIDCVVVNVGGEDSKPAIVHAEADCVVHGSDWQGPALLAQMGLTQAWLDEHGISMVTLPYTEWTSTTKILQGAATAGSLIRDAQGYAWIDSEDGSSRLVRVRGFVVERARGHAGPLGGHVATVTSAMQPDMEAALSQLGIVPVDDAEAPGGLTCAHEVVS